MNAPIHIPAHRNTAAWAVVLTHVKYTSHQRRRGNLKLELPQSISVAQHQFEFVFLVAFSALEFGNIAKVQRM